MPHQDELISTSLSLKPGDIIFTEMPYDNACAEDFEPVTNFKNFTVGHVAIWTGDKFTKPLAHSVTEGYRLPGIRLTNIVEGRHVVFRLNDKSLAEKVGLIARRWAMSSSIFDLSRFENVYPKRFWDSLENYEKHKYDFFSIPNATTVGPGTPYSFERASNQLYDRARNAELKKFTDDSLRRAIKFASRSELTGPISGGMRCSSFVISTVQAAVLSDLTRQITVKASFKHYKNVPFNKYANTVLVENWDASEKGQKLKQAVELDNFNDIFPCGVAINSKYAVPNDLFSSLTQSNPDWELVGSFSLYQGKVMHLRDKTKSIEPKATALSEEKVSALLLKQDDALQEQAKQEKQTQGRFSLFATPPRNKKDQSQSSGSAPNCRRQLF